MSRRQRNPKKDQNRNRKAGTGNRRRSNDVITDRSENIVAVPLREISVNFPEIGIPDRIHAKLVFSDLIIPGIAGADYVYKGNGMFDPRLAVGGGQPHYFDQMMALYQQFFVKKSTCEVQIVNRTPDTYGTGLVPHSEANSISYEEVLTGANQTDTLIPPAQGDVKRLIGTESTHSMLSLPSDDSTAWGTNAADPTNLWFWHIPLKNISLLGDISAVMTVKIIYHAVFFDRRYVAPS